MGAITAIGNSVAEFWQGLTSGKSGAGPITLFDTADYKTKFACEVKGLEPEAHFDHKELRKMDRYTVFAMMAAHEAVADSGIDLEKIDLYRTGVVVGSGIGGMSTFETEHRKLIERGPRRVSPFFVPMMISDIAAGQISMKYGMKGPNYATVSACATGTHAIGDAMRLVKYGDADIMVCGGSEATVCPMGVAGFNNMKAMSTRNDSPETASRPFDRDRDGFVMGEGAGILVIEELEHAQKRGAKIYAELRGIGFTADAHHLTAPAPGGEGAVRAMRRCIEDGGLNLDEIDYVNAHGTSTPFNDRNESAAIRTVFGDHADSLNVSSTKSMTGHLLGAAGGVEVVASAMAIMNNVIPPTINYETPDPECDLNYTPNEAHQREVRAVVSNTFGFGGHNACVSLSKF